MKKKKGCKCNGSGIIFEEKGTSRYCICYRLKRADELYKNSNAPSSYKVYIEDLSENPNIQNINKKEEIEEIKRTTDIQRLIREGELTKEEWNIIEESQIKPLKQVLKQFDNGSEGQPIKRFVEEGYTLFFFGDTGTGKSAAASSLLYQGNLRNQKGYYLSMHTIKKLFRYDFYNEEEKRNVTEELKKIAESDILIIDDLGKEIDQLNTGKDSDKKLLKEVHTFIDATLRERNRLVIFTSNLNKEDGVEKYKKFDPRLTSMIFEGKFISYKFRVKLREKERKNMINLF